MLFRSSDGRVTSSGAVTAGLRPQGQRRPGYVHSGSDGRVTSSGAATAELSECTADRRAKFRQVPGNARLNRREMKRAVGEINGRRVRVWSGLSGVGNAGVVTQE